MNIPTLLDELHIYISQALWNESQGSHLVNDFVNSQQTLPYPAHLLRMDEAKKDRGKTSTQVGIN